MNKASHKSTQAPPIPQIGNMVYSRAASTILTVGTDRKRVHFNDDVTFHEHATGPTTLAEKQSVWYSGRELIEIRKDIQVALHFKDTETPISNFDWRGLETHQTGANEEQVRKRQDFVSEFVTFHYELLCSEMHLNEQEEPLSQFSASKSKQSRKDALRRGKQDEATAKQVYRSSNVIQRRRSPNDKEKVSSRRRSFMTSLVKGFRSERKASTSMHKQVALSRCR
jgi:hypothetical protein